MEVFNYKKRNLFSGPHLLGTLLIVAGLFSIVSPTFLESGSSMERVLMVGTCALVVGLLIVSAFNGTVIDLTQRQYKEYFSIAGFKFGEWISLPETVQIEVVSISYRSSNTPNGISPTLSGRVTGFKLFVYADTSEFELSLEYTKKGQAIKNANELASKLNATLVLNVEKSA